jgi:hypothetical protein
MPRRGLCFFFVKHHSNRQDRFRIALPSGIGVRVNRYKEVEDEAVIIYIPHSWDM